MAKFNLRKMVIRSVILLILFVIGWSVCLYNEQAMWYSPVKQNRILVMITSYKRPMLLSGQILRFMNQTYRNFVVSVSIKGTEETWIRSTFMKEWMPFINQKKLMIRFDKNREQLSNLLDTIRDVPLNDYDYFCKVDDDDWYAPNYLEDVNKWLNKDEKIDFSGTTNMVFLEDGPDSTKMRYARTNLLGQTICISRKVVNMLFEIEKDPYAYNDLFPASEINRLKARREDALIHHFVPAVGGVLQESDTPKTDIIYGRQYSSVTRK